jgi:hypothetical protein
MRTHEGNQPDKNHQLTMKQFLVDKSSLKFILIVNLGSLLKYDGQKYHVKALTVILGGLLLVRNTGLIILMNCSSSTQ